MKQGILVTAFKEPAWLERVVQCFGPGFSFFIHVDRKSPASVREGYRVLATRYDSIVFLSSFYHVNWGGFNHLQAILLLVQQALESGMEYCHLITGQDYPVQRPEYFACQLSKGKNYMEFFSLPTSNWLHGGLDRLVFYHFYDVFDRKTYPGKKAIKILKSLQKMLPVRRKLPNGIRLYGGGTYWSLDRACLEYVMEYIQRRPAFLDRFRYTFCAEEIFFQTVLLNSPLRDFIVNDHRRYICWEGRHGSLPAILDVSDFEKITHSNALFARKIAYPESSELVDLVDRKVHQLSSV